MRAENSLPQNTASRGSRPGRPHTEEGLGDGRAAAHRLAPRAAGSGVLLLTLAPKVPTAAIPAHRVNLLNEQDTGSISSGHCIHVTDVKQESTQGLLCHWYQHRTKELTKLSPRLWHSTLISAALPARPGSPAHLCSAPVARVPHEAQGKDKGASTYPSWTDAD